MFDFSWTELAFVAVLALVIIGPKDLPQLFKMGTRFVSKMRRHYADVKGSLTQLEREIDFASGNHQKDQNWHDYLPESVRNLPDDFIPGSMTAEQHQARREKIQQAKALAEENKPSNNAP